MLDHNGLIVETIEVCSGYFSQKLTAGLRTLSRRFGIVAWVLTLPLRAIVPVIDRPRSAGRFPGYSICVVALNPRFDRLMTP